MIPILKKNLTFLFPAKNLTFPHFYFFARNFKFPAQESITKLKKKDDYNDKDLKEEKKLKKIPKNLDFTGIDIEKSLGSDPKLLEVYFSIRNFFFFFNSY